MKRWRTDAAAGRCLVVAVLTVLLAGGWLHEVRAEPKAPHAPTFSRAALDRIGELYADLFRDYYKPLESVVAKAK